MSEPDERGTCWITAKNGHRVVANDLVFDIEDAKFTPRRTDDATYYGEVWFRGSRVVQSGIYTNPKQGEWHLLRTATKEAGS